ncbi:GGDEF domain-containing protein [Congregibacter variabilis]|uniref:GGDEF domain-containing protein n=1 Tax=Congregibacter variabilis TaxID=3081200 RepID=A0ABZ0I6I3_9GAMM|nr:GGDEF domain-containing protein [Congregibacter sp. IMCC43200]
MHEIETREALRNRVWGSLPPVTIALGVLYVVFTISHSFLLPAEIRLPMVTIAGVTAIVLFCITVAVRRWAALKTLTYPIASLVMIMLSINSAFHVYLTQDMVQTTNVMLVILGAGLFVLSLPWYVLTLLVTLGSWVLAVAELSDHALFVHFAFALFSATIASMVFRFVHVRDLLETHRLRLFSEQQRQEMEHLATHDSLTGLANRRKFLESLTLQIAHANRGGHKVAVLYIDLDNFKAMNDTHGHEYGDEVLKVLGDTLRDSIRETDLASRLGGDEFAVLLTGLNEERAAEIVSSKILRQLQRPTTIQGISTVICLSIGTAVLSDEADAPDELLRMADERMYAHKASTR